MNGWMALGAAYALDPLALAIAPASPAAPPPGTLPLPAMVDAEPNWEERVGRAVRVPPGHGQHLTEAGWREHQRTLWTLPAGQAGAYCARVREELLARAAGPVGSSARRG